MKGQFDGLLARRGVVATSLADMAAIESKAD
jgi:hypothetical protein